jgi:hypothetical protein
MEAVSLSGKAWQPVDLILTRCVSEGLLLQRGDFFPSLTCRVVKRHQLQIFSRQSRQACASTLNAVNENGRDQFDLITAMRASELS